METTINQIIDGRPKTTTANKGFAIAVGRSKVHVLCFGSILYLVEGFGFDLPAIAKLRNVSYNYMKTILFLIFILSVSNGCHAQSINHSDVPQKQDDINYSAPVSIENIEKEAAVYIDRKNGFYFVSNYDSSKNQKLIDYILTNEPYIKLNEIKDLQSEKDNLGRNVVSITFTKTGTKKFSEMTRINIGKPIAIVVKKKLITAPLVQTMITDGKIHIAGYYSDIEMDEILKSLKE